MLERLCSCYEFLRSDDVIDRVEFIKWASTTTNDSGLLIAILERLDEIRREGDVDEVLTRRELPAAAKSEPDNYSGKNLLGMLWQLMKDFAVDMVLCGCARKQDFRDFEWGKLDPVRFVRVYKYLKQLENHVYNIHESSCLERISKPRVLSRFFHTQSLRDEAELEQEQKHDEAMIDWTILNVVLSILAIATQIVFIVFIITEIISVMGDTIKENDAKLLTSKAVITVATLTVFMGFVLENYVAANRATHVIQALRVRRAEYLGERIRRDFSLLLNLFGNGLLGYLLFWVNIPFIMSAESVTEAILNSLATVFLLEIDDRIKPFQPCEKFGLEMIDWDNDISRMNMIKLAHDYLYFKRDHRLPDHVEVTKVFRTFEETRDDDLRHSFGPQDYCRIYVDDWDDKSNIGTITVFRLHNEQMFPNIYEEIVYNVEGPAAKEFIANVRHFHRVHTDTSDASNEFSRKLALRCMGQKLTKSVLEIAKVSNKSYHKEYLEDMVLSDRDEEHAVNGSAPSSRRVPTVLDFPEDDAEAESSPSNKTTGS